MFEIFNLVHLKKILNLRWSHTLSHLSAKLAGISVLGYFIFKIHSLQCSDDSFISYYAFNDIQTHFTTEWNLNFTNEIVLSSFLFYYFFFFAYEIVFIFEYHNFKLNFILLFNCLFCCITKYFCVVQNFYVWVNHFQ